MHHRFTSLPLRRSGFSLIELLVGVAIGMVGLLVIFKTVAVWDVHTRSTVAGGDAQTTGALAMFNLERDLKQAGMGFGRAPSTVMGCTVKGNQDGRAFTFRLSPIEITFDSTGADSINVLYGNSSFFVDVATFASSTNTTKVLTPTQTKRRDGFKTGDLVVAADATDPTNCALLQITGNTNADLMTLDHAGSSYTSFYDGPGATPHFNSGTPVVFSSSGNLFDLGPTPQANIWKVDGEQLTHLDVIHGTSESAIAEGVVSMKAQYGIDANGDNEISDTEWTTTLPVPTDWTKVRAIRLAILVRSKQYEKSSDPSASDAATAVTPVAPSWSGSTTPVASPNPFVMKNIDGSPDSGAANPSPNNWRYYRYRVYEKEIPLRNMIWGTAP